jgi:glyoxylase-like metal-dependent hydrolase (beta-lactamase superfamily II)
MSPTSHGGELVVAEVARGVYVATAQTYTTTTTIVTGDASSGGSRPGDSVSCLLVDPAVSVADLAALARWLGERGLRPAAGWSTHAHWDHLLWSRALGDAPRYATPRAAAAAVRERAGLVAGVQESAPGHDLTLFGAVEPLPACDTDGPGEIGWPGPRAVVYPHDAHAPGHGAVFLPDAGVLIAGDMCSDIEIPLPDLDAPDPFGGYRAGLGTLAAIPGVTAVVPGHGHPGDAAEFRRRLDADLAYLDAVAAGTDYRDPRLTEGWLRAEHARALTRARSAQPT